MWTGRFDASISPIMQKLSYSLETDLNFYQEDIQVSIAHSHALVLSKVLTKEQQAKIETTLTQIKQDIEQRKDIFNENDEDLHMAIERILTERIGDLGKKLHTGRSRNDQVATDFRLYIRNKIKLCIKEVSVLQTHLFNKSIEYEQNLISGYTHLQQAQPILISHYLLSFFWALERDKSRLKHLIETTNQMPLGSGALAGSTFSYDRQIISEKLNFIGPTNNSIDATAHRDYVLETLSSLSILGNLLSRYAEDFIIWSSKEFDYIQLMDEWTTGSSMMPQKKNPDSMELIRGKTGRLIGNFTSCFCTVKGTPLSYNRDLQEDKKPVFDSFDTILTCLKVMSGSLKEMKFKTDIILSKMDDSILATDLADALVLEGMPFRETHEIVGKMIKKSEALNCSFLDLPNTEWKKIKNGLKIKEKISFKASTDQRNIYGGTSHSSIKKQLKKAQDILHSIKKNI